jgi:SET and MYND domain-containing protein
MHACKAYSAAASASSAAAAAAAAAVVAVLQVRHERPQGFIGVWPELALLRHSCAPNSSVVVVGKHALLHATADLEAGTEVTFNKLGR